MKTPSSTSLRPLFAAFCCAAFFSVLSPLDGAEDGENEIAALAADPGAEVSEPLPFWGIPYWNDNFLGIEPLDIPILSGFSLGAGIGAFHTDYASTVNDGSVTMVDDGDTGTLYNFTLGYRINDNISIEGGFSTSDDVDYSAVSSGGPSWTAGPVSAEYEADMWTVDVVGRFPIAPKWWLLTRVGYLHWETTETFNESGFISVDNESGSTTRIGIGLEYDIGLRDYFKYRFDLGYHRIGGNDDLDVVGAAFSCVFELP